MNVAFLFEQTVERYPERCALVCDGERFSYRAWHERVRRCALGLLRLGVGAGDRVAIFVPTSEVSATAYLATQLMGAVAVPLNFRLAPAEVAQILQDCDAAALIYGASLASAAMPALRQAAGVRVAIACAAPADAEGARQPPDDPPPPGDPPPPDLRVVPMLHTSFEALIDAGAGASTTLARCAPDQLAALMYTSGTTGRSKGVQHTHANDVAIAMNCVMEYGLRAEDVALHIAPLYHVGGMQAFFLPHLMVGATNVILPRYSPARTLATIARERVTTLFAVPTQLQELLQEQLLHEERQGGRASLRLITTGGAAISAASMQRVQQELCGQIYNGYGMTEASLTLLLHPRDALRRLGSCGKPTLISACRILAPRGQVGELLVCGPQVTPGYWNDAAATAAKLEDGWLHTGDLFSQDAEGFYYFHGRSDDLIVSGGENIYPREVEEVLYRCAGVQAASVVGLPDPKWGAQVTAFVVRSDPALSAATLDRHCLESGELAGFKRPRRYVFLERLPVSPSGKVLKRELLAQYSQPQA